MASNRSSSNGPDLMDVEAAWEGLQTIDKVEIGIHIKWAQYAKWEGLEMTASAVEVVEGSTEVRHLASAKLRCSTTEQRSLDTAVIRLLYLLDGAIAKAELDGPAKRS